MVEKYSGTAITSMILGIISLVLCWIFFIGIPLAILAIIFSFIGFKDMKKNKKAGKGIAITGLVTGILTLSLYLVIIIIGFVAIFLR